MTQLRFFNIAVVRSPGAPSLPEPSQDGLMEQSKAFHLGLLEQECRHLHLVPADGDLPLMLAQLRIDLVIVDAGGDTQIALDQLGADCPYPLICFNDDPDYGKMRSALENGASAYVAAGFSIERVRLALGVALARFEINQKQRRELLETRRKLAALYAQEASGRLEITS